jgi:hypothetical protein
MSFMQKIKYFLTDSGLEKVILPFYNKYFPQKNETGGSSDGLYVVQIFLLQIYFIKIKNKDIFNSNSFDTVCEFGPGDSAAIGMMHTLVNDCSKYVAFDAHPYLNLELTKKSCLDAVALLKDINTDNDLATIFENHRFKSYIDIELLFLYVSGNISNKIGLVDEKMIDIKISEIEYHAPYSLKEFDKKYSFDLIFSQAVLEHCDNLSEIYSFQESNLSPGGIAYNHIDFKSHGTSFRWNGHYGFSNKRYRALQKSNTFQWINRLPVSFHISAMQNAGLDIKELIKFKLAKGIPMNKVSKDMKSLILDQDDLNTHSSLIICSKE